MADDGDALPWRSDAHGVTLSARLTPRADRDEIEGAGELSDGRQVILTRVRAVAENGKASEAALKLLAEAAGVPPARLGLISGARARLKVFHIAGEPGA